MYLMPRPHFSRRSSEKAPAGTATIAVFSADLKQSIAISEENAMTKVNPVQTTTYYLTPANNPITFGPGTDIAASSEIAASTGRTSRVGT